MVQDLTLRLNTETRSFKNSISVNTSCMFSFFGVGNWWQAETWNLHLAEAVEVNALSQGALRQFTQWPWIEHQPSSWKSDTLQPNYCRSFHDLQ